MKEEIGQMNYRKLLYFFKNKVKVHFKNLENIFYNGLILDLSELKLTMVLQERVIGSIPILLEEIKTDSIAEFKEERE